MKCFYSISIWLFFTFSCYAEDLYRYLPLIDSLQQEHQISAARDLTQRLIFFCGNDSIKGKLYLINAKLELQLGNYSEVYPQLFQILTTQPANLNTKGEALILTGLSYIGLKDFGTALYFLEQEEIPEKYRTFRNIAAGYCHLRLGEKKAALEFFSYAGIDSLPKAYTTTLQKLKRKRAILMASSIVVPGSGQILQGKVVNGTTGLLVNLFWIDNLIIAASVPFFQAAIFVTPLFIKYYLGTIVRSDNIQKEKIEELDKALLFDYLNKLYK